MKLKFFLLLSGIIAGLCSCSLKDPIRSDVTEYAEFEMQGEQYIYLETGTAYEEQGVIAKAGEETLEVSIKGTVNTEVPGVYTLVYSAINADGFPAFISRYVAVGNKEIAAGRDLSGTYSPANTVTKLTDGIYLNSDLLPTNGLSAIMADLGNGSLVVPLQDSSFGDFFADPSIDPETFGVLNEDQSFTIHQMLVCCGIFKRTFVKQ